MLLMPGGQWLDLRGTGGGLGGGVMERDSQSSVRIWESGDPVERADLLPDAGINDFE